MDEAVLLTVLRRDEAEALLIVEPLHCSDCTHTVSSCFDDFEVRVCPYQSHHRCADGPTPPSWTTRVGNPKKRPGTSIVPGLWSDGRQTLPASLVHVQRNRFSAEVKLALLRGAGVKAELAVPRLTMRLSMRLGPKPGSVGISWRIRHLDA